MKKPLIGLALFLAAGSASAQSLSFAPLANNFAPAVSTLLIGNGQFPGGMNAATRSFLNGEITNGFTAGRNGFSGFAVISTRDTALAPLGEGAESLFAAGYDALLPLYLALDGPAVRLAALGTPLTEPLANGATLLYVTLSDSVGRFPTLPGLE